jgi:hypothetical protein
VARDPGAPPRGRPGSGTAAAPPHSGGVRERWPLGGGPDSEPDRVRGGVPHGHSAGARAGRAGNGAAKGGGRGDERALGARRAEERTAAAAAG